MSEPTIEEAILCLTKRPVPIWDHHQKTPCKEKQWISACIDIAIRALEEKRERRKLKDGGIEITQWNPLSKTWEPCVKYKEKPSRVEVAVNNKTCKDCPCFDDNICRLDPPQVVWMEDMTIAQQPEVDDNNTWCYRGREIMERDGKLVEVEE